MVIVEESIRYDRAAGPDGFIGPTSRGVRRCDVGRSSVHGPHLFTTRQLALTAEADERSLAAAIGAREP